jgi:hypothetical protein
MTAAAATHPLLYNRENSLTHSPSHALMPLLTSFAASFSLLSHPLSTRRSLRHDSYFSFFLSSPADPMLTMHSLLSCLLLSLTDTDLLFSLFSLLSSLFSFLSSLTRWKSPLLPDYSLLSSLSCLSLLTQEDTHTDRRSLPIPSQLLTQQHSARST